MPVEEISIDHPSSIDDASRDAGHAFPRVAKLLLGLGLFAAAGAAFAFWLSGTFAGTPDCRTNYNAFFVVFARGEVWGLAIAALFSASAVWLFSSGVSMAIWPRLNRRFALFLIAAGVFAVTTLGTHLVCHDYSLSADEFMADFQAQIFLRGQVVAQVPTSMLPLLPLIRPTYVDYLPAIQSWKAAYFPVYAAFRALFEAIYLQSLLNPLFAVVTLWALFHIVRRIWPEKPGHAFVAVSLLAASSQFLVMAMTNYAMTAHLCLNTIWLWLYTQPQRRCFYLAPVVGVLAIGLHQPIVHALFVLPFLLRLIWQRRWRPTLVYGLLYSLGCAFWYGWRLYYFAPAPGGIGALFRLFSERILIVQPMNVWLILGWSCLATPLLVICGLRTLRRSPPIVGDAALSCLLTFGFYFFFASDQGNGWGYRYFHGVLGCLVLVAVAGWDALTSNAPRLHPQRFLVAGVVCSWLILFPLRCFQAESYIRPFAAASAQIHASDAKIVGLDPRGIWYAADLIRNGPFLDAPPIVALIGPPLTASQTLALKECGKGRIMNKASLSEAELPGTPERHYWPDPFRLGYPSR